MGTSAIKIDYGLTANYTLNGTALEEQKRPVFEFRGHWVGRLIFVIKNGLPADTKRDEN